MIKGNNLKSLALSLAGYISACIIGPLLVIGGLGWYLDKRFDSSPKILLLAVLISFIITNILLFRQLKRINKVIDSYKNKVEEKINNSNTQINKNSSSISEDGDNKIHREE